MKGLREISKGKLVAMYREREANEARLIKERDYHVRLCDEKDRVIGGLGSNNVRLIGQVSILERERDGLQRQLDRKQAEPRVGDLRHLTADLGSGESFTVIRKVQDARVEDLVARLEEAHETICVSLCPLREEHRASCAERRAFLDSFRVVVS